MTAEADFLQSDHAAMEEGDDVAGTRIGLRTGANVEPGELDGYCENGVGVFLSADDKQALLTLYVVTPAESAVFVRPTLRITTHDGDTQSSQVSEFETIELGAGESKLFAAYTEGQLMDAEAQLSAY